MTDAIEEVQNHGTTTAVIDKIALRKPSGLRLDRVWVVPTDRELAGATNGYPPPRYHVVGWHWEKRMPPHGARVPPIVTGKYFRMNIVVVVGLAPGFTRGEAAGIDVWYHVGDDHYDLHLQTALAAVKGHTC